MSTDTIKTLEALVDAVEDLCQWVGAHAQGLGTLDVALANPRMPKANASLAAGRALIARLQAEAVEPQEPDQRKFAAILQEIEYAKHHGWPRESCERLERFSAAARPAPPAPEGPTDAQMLDFMAMRRVAVTPEFEGPWDASVYGEDEKPEVIYTGNTPRDAIRAAMAAQAGSAE